MLQVFIIEDEVPAQANLRKILKTNFDDLEIVGVVESIAKAVAWFSDPHNKADIVFMDVELSDGKCFEIFKQVNIEANIIITTAYDYYAVKAFKINSIDYLLKPIDTTELINAVNKCRKTNPVSTKHTKLIENILTKPEVREYKQRFIVKIGDRIIIVHVRDIAYFISQDKTSYLVTREGKQYIIDLSLDALEDLLNPKDFFRISRACITHIDAISQVTKHFSGRLKITLNPKRDEDIFVSRVRTSDFMHWINC